MHHTSDKNRRGAVTRVIFQDPFLNHLRLEKVSVRAFLINGQTLEGLVESFDQSVILMRSEDSQLGLQMIYKHAIASVVPTEEVNFPFNRPPGEGDQRRDYHQQNRSRHRGSDVHDNENNYRDDRRGDRHYDDDDDYR